MWIHYSHDDKYFMQKKKQRNKTGGNKNQRKEKKRFLLFAFRQFLCATGMVNDVNILCYANSIVVYDSFICLRLLRALLLIKWKTRFSSIFLF